MPTNHRTDIHRPVELIPEDYEEVGWYDLGTSEERPYFDLSPEARADDQAWQGVYGTNLDRCDHCGAHIRFGGELIHRPTGAHIHVGQTCLGNRFTLSTAQFQRLRKAAQLDREKQRILTAWNEYRAEHTADWDGLAASTNLFIVDVLSKGRKYGYLSDKQLAAIVKAYERDNRPPEPEEVKGTIVEGRQVITGKVVAVKLHDSQFGETWKVTVKDDQNRCYWGTVPTEIWRGIPYNYDETHAGTLLRLAPVITFTATVTVSDRDPSFGFYKRPAKASIVKGA